MFPYIVHSQKVSSQKMAQEIYPKVECSVGSQSIVQSVKNQGIHSSLFERIFNGGQGQLPRVMILKIQWSPKNLSVLPYRPQMKKQGESF